MAAPAKKDAEIPVPVPPKAPTPSAAASPPRAAVPGPLDGVIRHGSLKEAWLATMVDVDYIEKTKAVGLPYKFASEAAIVGKLHQSFVRHGLVICPSNVEMIAQREYPSAKGGLMSSVILRVTYTLSHAFSGESATIMAMGEAADAGDKATPKAMTAAFKYALRQAWMLETGDDPDAHASVPRTGASAAPIKRAMTVDEVYAKAVNAIPVAATLDDLDKMAERCNQLSFDAQQDSVLRDLFERAYLRLAPPQRQTAASDEDNIAF